MASKQQPFLYRWNGSYAVYIRQYKTQTLYFIMITLLLLIVNRKCVISDGNMKQTSAPLNNQSGQPIKNRSNDEDQSDDDDEPPGNRRAKVKRA